MLDWLKSVVTPAQPSGPPQVLRSFTAHEPTIDEGQTSLSDETLRVDFSGESSIRLYEIDAPSVENCMLTYRAEFRTENLTARTYLEMWCRFPGRGEFFSRGIATAVKGTNDWATYETPFFLKKTQSPDLIKLNVASEGEGTIWVRKIELICTPLQ